MIDTFVARAESEVEEWVLRQSDRVPMVASPPLFPKANVHLRCFFVTVGGAVEQVEQAERRGTHASDAWP